MDRVTSDYRTWSDEDGRQDLSLDEFVKTPVAYTTQEDEAPLGVKTTFGKYWRKCAICAAVLLISYMILIPCIASIIIGGEPLKLDKIEMFGLIAGTQSIRITTQLQLSKSLPRNSELPSPTAGHRGDLQDAQQKAGRPQPRPGQQ